jgi:hypothetical protein
MRMFLLLALLAGGCGDDTTDVNGDLSMSGDDASASNPDFVVAGDMPCANRLFPGFNGVQTSLAFFGCPCGCTVDAMESAVVNPMWGASHTANSNFAPIAGVGLGEDLHYSGSVEQLGLYSVGPTAQFFLDGDFDLLVDYDLVSAPPGETHLVVSVRDPGTVQGIQTFEIEREQMADGSNFYATMLGGVPNASVATTATHGTLRMTRQGFMYKTYGDGALVSTLIAQKAPRVAVTITGTLNGCTTSDMGTSCTYQPRFHNVRLASGTLVNLP